MEKMSLRSLLPVILAVGLMISGCAGSSGKLRVLWPPPPLEPKLEWIGTYASELDFPQSEGDKLRAKMFGASAQYPFQTPLGIVSDGKGKVYVADVHLKNVRIFDFNDHSVHFITKQPVFSRPFGMARDKAGNLYVADGEQKKILVFSPDDQPKFSFGDNKLFENPAYLAVNDAMGRIYVSDGKAHQIVVFNLQGEHLFSFGKVGRNEGEFHSPQGMAIDANNNLYVADLYNARIQVFDADGNFQRAFGQRGDQVWQFEQPRDLAFDSSGNLYVVDSRRAHMLTYTPDGTLLLVTGADKPTSHPLGFTTPSAIYIDQNDRIYVSDMFVRRFTVWQYLTPAYLDAHPVTEADRQRIQDEVKKNQGKK